MITSAVLPIVNKVLRTPVLAVEAANLTLWHAILQENIAVSSDAAGLGCTGGGTFAWIVVRPIGDLRITEISILTIAKRSVEGVIAVIVARVTGNVGAVGLVEIVAIGSGDHHLELATILTSIGRGLCRDFCTPQYALDDCS